jgi:hypothetical protein
MDTKNIFKPDGKQAAAVIAMIGAVFAFAAGEFVLGGVCFVIAATFSLGGLFWNAHRADKEDAAEAKAISAATATAQKGSLESNRE